MRRLALLLLLPGCFAPFTRGTYDNRPADRHVVAQIHADGRIELQGGRTVRLFGLRGGAGYVRRFEGMEVSFEAVLPTDPPAVELVVWEYGVRCGNSLMTWNPLASGYPAYFGFPVNDNMARWSQAEPHESDLAHGDAPAALVKSLRDGFAYRDKRRAGSGP